MLKKDLKKAFFKPRLSLITLCLVQIYGVHADDSVYYNPRVTGQFLTGGNQQLGGFGDGMIPLFQTPDRMFFADGTVLVGQNQRLTYSGGLGYRQIKDTFLGPAIWGAFGFVDYYRTRLNHQYTQINPGLEWLAESYEARIQGYIPVSSRSIAYGNTFAGAIPDNILFDSGRSTQGLVAAVGHQIIDTPVQLMEEFGPGVELELGRHFNYGKGMWVRAGGYHFSYKNSNEINGVQANIELAIKDSMSLIIQDNYDGQNRNRFAVGLRVNFGGSTAPKNTLEHLMTTPIIRHAARQSYGEALPTRQSFVASGPTSVIADNVWFFSPNGAFPAGAATTWANCTAEHPCSTINSPTASKIAAIAPNAKFYFESGSYLIPQGSPRWANLQNGQTLWGRNTGWLTPAVGAARPLIQGGLVWGNQATNTIANGEAHNIRILNNNQITPQSVFDYGVGGAVFGLAANGRLIVENSQIEANATSNNISALGIAANTASIERTVINANTSGLGNVVNSDDGPRIHADAVGVYTINQLTALKNSVIQAQSNGAVSNNGAASAYGVFSEQSSVNVSISTISAITRGNVNTGAAVANGVFTPLGKSTVRGAIINALTYGDATGTPTVNAFASATGVETAQADVKNSKVTVSTSGNVIYGQAIAFGVEGGTVAEGNIFIPGTATVEGSTVKVSSSGNVGQNAGVFAQGVRASTDVIVRDSTVTANTTGAAQDGGAANPVAVRAFETATVTGSTLSAESFGAAINDSNVNSTGILGDNGVTSKNNTITAITRGNVNSSFAQAKGVQSGNTAVIEKTVITAEAFGNAVNGADVNSWGVLAQNESKVTLNSTITVRTHGNTDSSFARALGVQSGNNTTVVEDTVITAESFGNAVNGADRTSWGILVLNGGGLTSKHNTITVRTHGNTDSSNAQVTGLQSENTTVVEDTVITAETLGDVSNNANATSWGILTLNAGELTSKHNTITVRTHGNTDNFSNAQALGVQSGNTTLVENTVITSETLGDAANNSNAGSFGILTINGEELTSKDNTITVSTHGNTSNNSFNQAVGINATSVIIERSVINVLTTGTGGGAAALGVVGAGVTGTIEFQGTGASRVTAIAENDFEAAVQAGGGVTNASTPPSQCSTDGVNYVNCS